MFSEGIEIRHRCLMGQNSVGIKRRLEYILKIVIQKYTLEKKKLNTQKV